MEDSDNFSNSVFMIAANAVSFYLQFGRRKLKTPHYNENDANHSEL
jgi:hypothetical protein